MRMVDVTRNEKRDKLHLLVSASDEVQTADPPSLLEFSSSDGDQQEDFLNQTSIERASSRKPGKVVVSNLQHVKHFLAVDRRHRERQRWIVGLLVVACLLNFAVTGIGIAYLRMHLSSRVALLNVSSEHLLDVAPDKGVHIKEVIIPRANHFMAKEITVSPIISPPLEQESTTLESTTDQEKSASSKKKLLLLLREEEKDLFYGL